ncbi:MAG: hypothetical protein K8S20_11965 [Chloroflexi bacterium]|nr:hypothetical protein [Chloroflexota bacterium]
MTIIFLFKKYLGLLLLLFIFVVFFSLWQFPAFLPLVGTALLLFSLAVTISSIFKNHQESENPRLKIARDIATLLATLVLILFLGWQAGLYANSLITPHFGTLTGLLCAIGTSFAVGYWVKKGAGKFLS